ncbi:MAG: CARDB domain-containing protein, partial [Candidatus Micrarchaeota archaeon]
GQPRILLGDIARGGSVEFSLPIATSSSTPVGLYSVPITLAYTDELGAEQNSTLSITPVYVASAEPKLVVSVDTGGVEPGEEFEVKITLRNVGTSDANRITLALAISLPFIPIESGNLYLDRLGVGEERTLSVKMTSDSSTESKTYLIPLSATYADESNTHYNISDYVGIDMKGRAKLSISRVKSSPEELTQGGRASLEVRIENYGNGEAKNVRAFLTIDGDQYETVVGKIAAGDRANANFPLERIPSAGKITVNMKVTYEDPEGWKTTDEGFQLVVYGGGGGVSALTIFIILAIIGAAAYVFRDRVFKTVKKTR